MGRKKLSVSIKELKNCYYTASTFISLLKMGQNVRIELLDLFTKTKAFDLTHSLREGFYAKDKLVKKEKSVGDSFYVLKEKLSDIISAYEADLIALGAPKEVLFVYKHNIPTNTNHQDIRLWDFAHFYARNTKSTALLADYIKNELLPSHYKSGETEDFFSVRIPKQGRVNFYIKKEMAERFKKRYGDCLKQKAQEIESENEFTDLDSLRRLLRNTLNVSTKDLHTYICENAMAETIKIKKDGEEITVPVFEYKKAYLMIRKEGIYPFVKAHLKGLKALGFKNPLYYAENQDTDFEAYISIADISKKISLDKNKLNQFVLEPVVHETFVPALPQKKEVAEPLFFNARQTTFIKKKHFILFLSLFYHELIRLGGNKDRLDNAVGINLLKNKTDEMIPLNKFYRMFSLSGYAEKTKTFLQKFKDARYDKYLPDGTCKSEPVFVRTVSGGHVRTEFQNKEALKAFVLNNHQEMATIGMLINPLYIQSLRENIPVQPHQEGYVALPDLCKMLRINRQLYHLMEQKYFSETYTSIDEKGMPFKAPMFIIMRKENGFGIVSAIKKEAIYSFAKKHAKEFNITTRVLYELQSKEQSDKKDELISLYALWHIIGKGSRTGYLKLQNLVENQFKDETYPLLKKDKTIQETPLFVKGYSKNKKLTYYIPLSGVDTFLSRHTQTLVSLGMRAAHIQSFFMAPSQKNFIPLATLFKQKFIRTRE